MRKINKENPFEDFKQHIEKYKPSKWEDIDGELRYNMRSYMLLYEQQCLCGYSEIPIEAENTSSHIDHFIKRNHDNQKIFDWNNMIVSTIDEDYGGKYKDNTYRIAPGEYSLIFNPVIEDMSQYIEFSGDGSIVPKSNIETNYVDKVNKTVKVFNLNNNSLKNRRKSLLQSLYSCKELPKDNIKQSFESQGFVSLIDWFLSTY